MLRNTSTEWAPWYVIPADRKWYARIATGAVIVKALIDIDPHYPTVDDKAREELKADKKTLEAQPPGAALIRSRRKQTTGRQSESYWSLDNAGVRPISAEQRWYALKPETDAASSVSMSNGSFRAEAAERLKRDGLNALPAETPPSALHRFLSESTSYMQLILVGAAVVSLVIGEWTTAILLLAITLLINAVVGLRQEGKAESAMNALKSMMKATARVRRGRAEAEIPAEQLVPGDVVLITAGDEVPAAVGRLVAASSLQIDESALTGESVPVAKEVTTLTGTELELGDRGL